MSVSRHTAIPLGTTTILVLCLMAGVLAQKTAPPDTSVPFKSTMANPYQLVENWPILGAIPPGPAIGIVPDGTGGVWILHRSNPPIVHIDASGKVVKSFGDGMFGTVHAFCRDKDGNFWAGDSGPFSNNPEAVKKAYVMYKFSPEGQLLLTLGKAGVQKSGPDTFMGPAACIAAPNGDIIIADGHQPRPQELEDGNRLVRYSKDGTFIRAYGKQGTAPGEFFGPHSLAYDSRGRLFVADRSNNRIQIFDQDMNFVDEWRHFGRPSGVAILKDDTLVVADSESGYAGFRPVEIPAAEPRIRNAGWQRGIKIGSAKDGSLRYVISATAPEGMAADELGNIFGGLTAQCSASADKPTPGGPNCLQKWVKK